MQESKSKSKCFEHDESTGRLGQGKGATMTKTKTTMKEFHGVHGMRFALRWQLGMGFGGP
jgi:hypothetical protein